MKGRRDGGLGTKPYALGSLSAFAANFFADIAGARELQKVARPRCSSLLGLRATYPLYQRCVGCEDGECRGSQRESCGESRDSTTREKARQGKSGERGFFLKFFFPSLAVESFTLSPSLFGLLFSLREGARWPGSGRETRPPTTMGAAAMEVLPRSASSASGTSLRRRRRKR